MADPQQLGDAGNTLQVLLATADIPIQNSGTQAFVEDLIKACSLEELEALGLTAPPKPAMPKGLEKLPMRQRLQAVQKVISSLQYNHNNGYYYNVSKARPFARIMDTARDALRLALPIKCLEASFLGAYLTAGWEGLERLPVGFKSMAGGAVYRHIILAVFHAPSRKWGALGISRRAELMDKDLVYDSLADLMSDYKASYERWWHTLVKVYVGLPMEHDVHYAGPVCWRCCVVSPSKKPWPRSCEVLNKFAGSMQRLALKFRMMGGNPKPSSSSVTVDAPPPAGARAAKSVSPSRRRPAVQPSKDAHPSAPGRSASQPRARPVPVSRQGVAVQPTPGEAGALVQGHDHAGTASASLLQVGLQAEIRREVSGIDGANAAGSDDEDVHGSSSSSGSCSDEEDYLSGGEDGLGGEKGKRGEAGQETETAGHAPLAFAV